MFWKNILNNYNYNSNSIKRFSLIYELNNQKMFFNNKNKYFLNHFYI